MHAVQHAGSDVGGVFGGAGDLQPAVEARRRLADRVQFFIRRERGRLVERDEPLLRADASRRTGDPDGHLYGHRRVRLWRFRLRVLRARPCGTRRRRLAGRRCRGARIRVRLHVALRPAAAVPLVRFFGVLDRHGSRPFLHRPRGARRGAPHLLRGRERGRRPRVVPPRTGCRAPLLDVVGRGWVVPSARAQLRLPGGRSRWSASSRRSILTGCSAPSRGLDRPDLRPTASRPRHAEQTVRRRGRRAGGARAAVADDLSRSGPLVPEQSATRARLGLTPGSMAVDVHVI